MERGHAVTPSLQFKEKFFLLVMVTLFNISMLLDLNACLPCYVQSTILVGQAVFELPEHWTPVKSARV
jgi:hypothetical protein